MQLVENPSGGMLFVRHCSSDRIVVVDRVLEHSFMLTPEQLIEAWPVTDATQLESAHAQSLLALAPEVVLLGTGSQQRFPPAAFSAEFLTRGIGIEPMDNAAAARTFNVLAAEGRRVIAAFMLGAMAGQSR